MMGIKEYCYCCITEGEIKPFFKNIRCFLFNIHKWETHKEYNDDTGINYHLSTYKMCDHCGSYKELWHHSWENK